MKVFTNLKNTKIKVRNSAENEKLFENGFKNIFISQFWKNFNWIYILEGLQTNFWRPHKRETSWNNTVTLRTTLELHTNSEFCFHCAVIFENLHKNLHQNIFETIFKQLLFLDEISNLVFRVFQVRKNFHTHFHLMKLMYFDRFQSS